VPRLGGKVKSFEADKVTGMPGVKHVLKVGEIRGLGRCRDVVAGQDRARRAADHLDEGPNAQVSSASIAEILKAGLDADQAFVRTQTGDVKGAIAGAAKKVEAVYAYPFQNHAPMEPMNATARYTPERCEVWVPTQNGEAAFAATTAASGLPADKCDVYKINLGGGFGRRGAFHDYVTQAVLIAKQVPGTPVKLLWTREEDMTQGRYHPVMQSSWSARWTPAATSPACTCACRGSRSSPPCSRRTSGRARQRDLPGLDPSGDFTLGYTVPNLLIDHAMRNTHVPPGFWRGVNINQNAIFLECFMDELAQAAGQDPLEFRRKLMSKHPKHLAVLNAVADRAGWGKAGAAGVHRGLAQMMAFGSYVAGVRRGLGHGGDKVKVRRIVCATDPGYAVNPARSSADRRLVRLRSLGGVHGRVHGEERGHRADELQHLRFDEDRADAEGRVDHHAVRRLLGRRR
jgi:isoquinoline 1-oxidoreductase beta subunit